MGVNREMEKMGGFYIRMGLMNRGEEGMAFWSWIKEILLGVGLGNSTWFGLVWFGSMRFGSGDEVSL